MMNYVLLITIFDLDNYGNRLQNYALQQKALKYAKRVRTLPDVRPYYSANILSAGKHILGILYKKWFGATKHKRSLAFWQFTIKNIPTISYFRISRAKKAEGFLVGSDQVWNPYFNHLSDYDTLEFVKNNDVKGIAYAASFGVDELPKEYVSKLQQIAGNFSSISVREESGKRLLEEYTDRKDIEVLVDPTLLLTSEEWKKVAAKPKKFNHEKFVLLYFLGDLSEERRKQIEFFAAENQCEIVELMDRSSVYYTYGPAEFLWVMQHAEAVFTDSFHGCVFSFLFDKPFVVYDREDHNQNMSSRMETLLPLFHLEDRAYTGELPNGLLEHDYSSGYVVLEEERKRSFDYLNQNLR